MGKRLIVLVGPTAVGKTDLAIQLAKHFKTEIISADSRQFYREMNLGTAKPSKMQLEMVPHHFINSLSIHDYYTAGDFENDALKRVDQLFEKYPLTIMVGGSGMYVKAVCEGFDKLPSVPPSVRERLMHELENRGLEYLANSLKAQDPEYFNVVDAQNPQRVVRALEIIEHTGNKFSSFIGQAKAERSFEIIKIGIEMSRNELYSRIDKRMEQMIENGLFEEAAQLYEWKDNYALKTVGYTEIFDYLDGNYDRIEAVRLLKRNSRRYSKRQLTWFKKDQDVHWFHPSDWEGIVNRINQSIERT